MKRLLFLCFITCLFVLVGCSEQPSEKVLRYQENNEIIDKEKDEIIGEVSDTIYITIDRSNAEAEEIIVSPVVKDMPDIIPKEGRYSIAPLWSEVMAPQSGRVLVYDQDNVLLVSEVFDSWYGVESVTVDLNGSHSVHLDGINEAIITPVETQFSNQLSAGIWEVGKDIEAGEYSVYASEYGVGDLHVYEEGKSPRVFEFLDASSKVDIQLIEGQRLRVSGLSLLEFEAK